MTYLDRASMLAWALWYADMHGCPVFPLGQRLKEPDGRLVRNGLLHATTDTDMLHYWWSRSPRANIGIRCTRFVVLDVDPKDDGPKKLAELVAQHGPLSMTPSARTGSGGLHILFAPVDFEIRGAICKGLDLRGRGGYIAAPPSIHPNGNRYEWIDPLGEMPVAPAPSWLLAMMRRPEPEPVDVDTSRYRNVDRVERARKYAAALPPAVSGQHGHTSAFVAACKVARGFALSEDEALVALVDWNKRCEPPWSSNDLKRKIKQALTYGTQIGLGEMLEGGRA